MALGKGRWLALALGLAAALTGAVWGVYGYFPSGGDLKDPLAEPPELGAQMTVSAHHFDRLTKIMVGQHTRLPDKVSVLVDLAGDLEELVARAGSLQALADSLSASTTKVVGVARPLPAGIAALNARGGDGTRLGARLEGTLSGVSAELAKVAGRLAGMLPDVNALGPRAAEIAARLREIERSSQGLAPAGGAGRSAAGLDPRLHIDGVGSVGGDR